jgi:hypothetical protein
MPTINGQASSRAEDGAVFVVMRAAGGWQSEACKSAVFGPNMLGETCGIWHACSLQIPIQRLI